MHVLKKFLISFYLINVSFCSSNSKDQKEKISQPELIKYKAGPATMQYAVQFTQKQKLVIFIHGSPGSWEAFSDYLNDKELQNEAILISVDRHGYGGSMRGEPELSIGNHARYLKPILDKYTLPTIVVGHSYGGPVALRLGMDYPAQVSALLLLAPSISPELEEVQWYQRLADKKVIRWILPSSIDVTNQEILPLRFELKKIAHLWKDLQIPMTIIQGDNDSLVPPGNADYAEKMFPDKSKLKIIRGDMNHFIPWNQKELIKKEILVILKNVE